MWSYETWCIIEGEWVGRGEKIHGKEYSGMKKSVQIPDILLNLSLESIAGAKKKNGRRENEAHHLVLLIALHHAPSWLGERGDHGNY